MRNFLLATSAAIALIATSLNVQAADMRPLPPPPPYPAPVYVPPPIYDWTGFYIGGNLGAGWTSGNVSDSVFGLSYTASNTNTGVFLGGGQVGANYQIGTWVLGVEADFDWAANNQNSGGTTIVSGTPIQVSSNNRWITTLAGRFGYALDNVLFYGKGGGAWVGNSNFSVTNVTTGTSVAFSNSSTNSGWLVGTGIEWAFARNWTAKLEYDYVGLNNASYTLPATFPVLGADTFSTTNRNVQMFTVGVNYLFH